MVTAKKSLPRTPAALPGVSAAVKKVPAKKAPAKTVAVKAKLPAPAVKKADRTDKPVKVKAKLVRDSFTMPASDFALIGQLKDKALGFKRPTKKSELLRAGLQALSGLSDAKLKAALDALAPLQAGRPKKALTA